MDLFELHDVLVVQLSHYLDFINKTFFAFLLGEQILFGKSFHCELLLVLFVFDQIHPGEGAFSYHFDGVELLMKIAL
jgi:hypothetical protein